jgi:hypothetical protein
MKHSIRFIQVNYTRKGAGENILILRGMEIRSYKYRVMRFDELLYSMKYNFESNSYSDRITFTRIYPQD